VSRKKVLNARIATGGERRRTAQDQLAAYTRPCAASLCAHGVRAPGFMTSRPTIRDVAKAAGVSVTTVSHALNGKGRVDPETRALVGQVVRELGYRANRHAQVLRSGRTGALALLLPVQADEALSLDFYMRLASAAASAAFARDQALMLLPPAVVNTGLDGIGVDGGIVVDPAAPDPRVELLAARGLPVVTIERDLGRPDDPWYVTGQAEASTRRLLDHLRAQGARRICLLAPPTDWGWITETRGTYDQWVAEQGAPRLMMPAAIRHGEQSAYEATKQLLAEPDPPDAILVVMARFIPGVQRAVKEAGRRVPGELLIAASVDSVHAREGDPPVTAIDLHPDRQAEAAVEMLLARVAGQEPAAPRLVPTTLHLRASTGAG
jgi:DNA-binding LacI/PurR family transcriptional regulator